MLRLISVLALTSNQRTVGSIPKTWKEVDLIFLMTILLGGKAFMLDLIVYANAIVDSKMRYRI